jgi:2-dehydro-3-deoxygluconokinase
MRVLTMGETMGLAVSGLGEPLRHATSARLSVAGAESTVAIGLRRLGVESCWVGVVGADELGARIRRELRAEGVDVLSVRTDADAATGFMLRELRTAELSKVTYYRSGSAGSRLAPRDVEEAFERFAPELVHITGITPALSDNACAAVLRAVELARSAAVEVSLDVNHRSSLPGSADAMKVVRSIQPDVLFVGADEVHVVCDESDPERAAQALATTGVPEVVVTLGGAGALARVGDSVERVGALAVHVIDVVGAGDGFVAGYLAARAGGLAVAQRLRWGTICAACSVGSHGDWEGLPTRAELERFATTATTER